MAHNSSEKTATALREEASDQPLKQWELRAATRALQRSREGMGRRNPADQMVAAGWDLVNEGVEFTVKQVAERANVALQTFYRHFGSKDELLLAMLEEFMNQGMANLMIAASELTDPVEQLRFLVTHGILLPHDENAVKQMQWRARERHRLSQLFPEAVEAVDEPYRAAVVAAIEAAREAGRLTSPNPALDGNIIKHLVLTMTHLQWGGGARESPDVTAEAVWRLCWEGLGARAAEST